MKKIYFAPETIVVKTNPSSIIAVSSPQAAVDKSAEGVDPDDFEAKMESEWDIWSKEEEEYEEYADYDEEY